MKEIYKQFMKYCIVGGTGFVVNTVILYGLTEYLNVWYMLAYLIGVAVAMVTNFLMNLKWTFAKQTKTDRAL